MIFDNLIGEERDLYIEDAKLELDFGKLETLMNVIEMQREQNTMDAEYRVFAESGTCDDLAYLYEAVEAEANKAKKNIFKKIIEWFKNVLTTIASKIKSIGSKKIDGNTDVKVSKEVDNAIKSVDSLYAKFNAGITNLKAGKFSEAWGNLKDIVIPSVIGAGAVTTGVVMYKKGKLDTVIDSISKKSKEILDVVESVISNIPDTLSNLVSKIVSPFKKYVSFCNNIVTIVTSAILKSGNVKDEKDVKESADTLYGIDLSMLDFNESAVQKDDNTENDDDAYLNSILGL